MGFPTVYPTGTTVYDPSKCWSGYTVFQAKDVGATIIDMNGNIVRQIQRLHGFPNKLLPNGDIMGQTGRRDSRYGYQDMKSLVQVNWEGEITWRFDHYERIEDPGEKPQWMARQIGPDYSKTKALRELEWIIGPHHAHIIPSGLPGEGNLLVFDKGDDYADSSQFCIVADHTGSDSGLKTS